MEAQKPISVFSRVVSQHKRMTIVSMPDCEIRHAVKACEPDMIGMFNPGV